MIGQLASETGKLPTEVLWGADAMQERTEWHLAFDICVMQTLWKARKEERERLRHEHGLKPDSHHIKGNRGTGLNLPDPAPPPERR